MAAMISILVIYSMDSIFAVEASPSFITISSSESTAGSGGLLKKAPIPPDRLTFFSLFVFFGSRVGYESSGSLRTSRGPM